MNAYWLLILSAVLNFLKGQTGIFDKNCLQASQINE